MFDHFEALKFLRLDKKSHETITCWRNNLQDQCSSLLETQLAEIDTLLELEKPLFESILNQQKECWPLPLLQNVKCIVENKICLVKLKASCKIDEEQVEKIRAYFADVESLLDRLSVNYKEYEEIHLDNIRREKKEKRAT